MRKPRTTSRELKSLHVTETVYTLLSSNLTRSDQPLVIILSNLTFPAILCKVFHEFSILVCEVDSRHIGHEEVCHKHPSDTADSSDDECPASPAASAASAQRERLLVPFSEVILDGCERLGANGSARLPDGCRKAVACPTNN